MRDSTGTPKWMKPPEGCRCNICGQTVHGRGRSQESDDYEVVKPKGGRPTAFYHTACIEKERRTE